MQLAKRISGAGNVVFQARRLIGVRNVSLSAQTVTLKLYDNPLAASGPVLDDVGPLGIEQEIAYSGNGIPVTTGWVTVVPSGAPTADGIEITYAVDEFP